MRIALYHPNYLTFCDTDTNVLGSMLGNNFRRTGKQNSAKGTTTITFLYQWCFMWEVVGILMKGTIRIKSETVRMSSILSRLVSIFPFSTPCNRDAAVLVYVKYQVLLLVILWNESIKLCDTCAELLWTINKTMQLFLNLCHNPCWSRHLVLLCIYNNNRLLKFW